MKRKDKRMFEKMNKIEKPLARFIKKQRKKAQINKIRNEKGEVAMETTEIQSITRDYYKQLYANKMNNLPKLNQEEIENMRKDQSQVTKLKL